MLQTLDALIAFVVIMTVVSLLITLLVQMVSAALSLRGKNLANALAITFQSIAPTLGEDAHKLAEHILRDPILSDSLTRAKSRATADATELRTKPAPWGFFDVSDIAKAWQLGTAVRPGEVYRILHDLAGTNPAAGQAAGTPTRSQAGVTTDDLGKKAQQLLTALGTDDNTAQAAKDKVQAVASIINQFASGEEKKALLDTLTGFGKTVDEAATVSYTRFQRWFGSAQDRAEQWFQMHTRWTTIFFSFLLAFLFQLDTVEIYRRLSVDQENLVPAVLKLEPKIEQQREAILKLADATSAPSPAAGETPGPAKAASTDDVKALATQYETLADTLKPTGFDVMPEPLFSRWDAAEKFVPGPSWGETIAARAGFYVPHFIGLLITAGLLTLGAPFWFNLLKNLMSLRPAVATLVARRPQSSPALPDAPGAPQPPTS